MSDYKVNKAWIEEIGFEILVLKLPNNKGELEDKLAYLARDKGNISKSFYEDFVIVTCVANINQLLFHIKQQQQHNNSPDLMKVRAEVMSKILEINPALEPDNLVINRNFVVKIKPKDGPKEDETPLVENKAWETSYFDEVLGNYGDPNITKDGTTEVGEIKPIDSLEFKVNKKWWSRINKYIDIKEFKEEDVASIVNQRFFHNRSSFQTYIVSICVVDSEDLFVMLDNMGVPSRVAPPILMYEVYELCRELNPFLTYENAKKFMESLDDEEEDNPRCAPNRASSSNKMKSHAGEQQSRKKKTKKKFKDLSKEELLNLADTMKIFVIGQDNAINHITSAIKRASVGLKDPTKPIGSFLFAGRTGIGKSLTSKVLANELIKDKDNLIIVDCSEYSADHEYAKLIGAPSGYVGHEQGGILTNAVSENPFSVVVFDEVEKASHKVHELMLQILEEGRLTDGRGTKVSFKDTIIIMTSNVGVSEVDKVKKTVGFGSVAKLTEERKTKSIDRAIKKKFKPEFINRIDAIIHFNSLHKDDYMKIIDIELHKLNENLRNNDTEYKNVKLEFSGAIKEFIYKKGIDEDYGARPLKRCIEKEVSDKLAEVLLGETSPISGKVKVGLKNNKITFDFEKEELIKSDKLQEVVK